MLSRIRRPQLERRFVEPRRGRIGVERERAVACLLERLSRTLLDVLCRFAGCSRKLERARVVVREHFRVIVRTPERFDPFRSATMLAGARSTRNLPIRDIANENVAERMLRFVRNGRLPSALHESLALECMQMLLGFDARAPVDEPAEPEDLSEHRCVLE